MPQIRAKSPRPRTTVPGRTYGFAVTFLAVLLAGVSAGVLVHRPSHEALTQTVAIDASDLLDQPAAERSPSTQTVGREPGFDVGSDRLSRIELKVLFFGALVVAGLTLVVPRRKPAPSTEPAQVHVQRLTDLPVLGTMFRQPGSKTSPRRGVFARGLSGLTRTSELVLALAIFSCVSACALNPNLIKQLQRHPLHGYQSCLEELTGRVDAIWSRSASSDQA